MALIILRHVSVDNLEVSSAAVAHSAEKTTKIFRQTKFEGSWVYAFSFFPVATKLDGEVGDSTHMRLYGHLTFYDSMSDVKKHLSDQKKTRNDVEQKEVAKLAAQFAKTLPETDNTSTDSDSYDSDTSKDPRFVFWLPLEADADIPNFSLKSNFFTLDDFGKMMVDSFFPSAKN